MGFCPTPVFLVLSQPANSPGSPAIMCDVTKLFEETRALKQKLGEQGKGSR
jgi:hypothetical protein